MKRGSEESSPSRTRLDHGGYINLPLDLELKILKKLPAKSLMRFRCVSKLWSSIISSSRHFIDSIVTRSLTHDALIIYDQAAGGHNQRFLSFTSSTCPKDTITVSPVLVPDPQSSRQYVRGLILSQEGVIYNPTTRQTFYLPEKKREGMVVRYLGYDPVENKYKALLISVGSKEHTCHVFTLGDPMRKEWRTIQGTVAHCPTSSVVCVKGVIHYIARVFCSCYKYKMMSFDVRSEKFYHMEAPETLKGYRSRLINYQGKLGFVCLEKGMEIWVMEGTQEWSMIYFYEMEGFKRMRIHGATRGGEIVFNREYMYFYGGELSVLYYDPKRNSMRYVDLIVEGNYVWSFWTAPDHVENTMCLYHTIS